MTYSTIKQKTGICPDCPEGKGEQPVIAGRCQYHYWKHRNGKNEPNKVRNRLVSQFANSEQGKDSSLGEWFVERRAEMSGVCCNCGAASAKHSESFFIFSIAHILPKSRNSGFPSISQHPSNWFELCITCHTAYDSSWATASKMPCFGIARERFKKFEPFIEISERRRIPEQIK